MKNWTFQRPQEVQFSPCSKWNKSVHLISSAAKVSSMACNSISLFKDTIQSILDDQTKPWHPILCVLEQQCGISKFNAFFLLSFCIIVYLMFGMGAALLCNLVGFIYPACKTLQVLRSPSFNEDAKWLTYWLIFGFLALVDYFADWLEEMCPLYWLLKSLVLLWCMSDLSTNGSCVIYSYVLKPLLPENDCFGRCPGKRGVNSRDSSSTDCESY